jgi:hypothetical protein
VFGDQAFESFQFGGPAAEEAVPPVEDSAFPSLFEAPAEGVGVELIPAPSGAAGQSSARSTAAGPAGRQTFDNIPLITAEPMAHDDLFDASAAPLPVPVTPMPAPSSPMIKPDAGPIAVEQNAAAGGMNFGGPPSDSGFSFQGSFDDAFASPGAAAPAAAGAEQPQDRIQALLDQGQEVFERGDYQGAIDTWTRIYLLDSHHAEAERRIEQARRRREEVERQAEHKFFEARDAFEHGRTDEARSLCQEVLSLQPQHLEAHDLMLRLEVPAYPPPPPSSPPPSGSLEEDLFRDDFVPATISTATPSGPLPAVAWSKTERARSARLELKTDEKPKKPPVVAIAVGGAVVLALVVAGFLGSKMFSSSSGAVTEALTEAQKLAETGQLQNAIQMLQAIQVQAEGEQAELVNQRILEYKAKFGARQAAQKLGDPKPALDAIAAGQRLKALRLVHEGFVKAPGDPELTRIQNDLLAYGPSLPQLLEAAVKRNWESASQAAGFYFIRQPDDPEAKRLWSAATLNYSIALLRKYQVSQAHALLADLQKKAPDPEIERLEQLSKSYLSRPRDPRYDIYVNNLELRALE